MDKKKRFPVLKLIILLIGLIGIVVAGLAALGPKTTEVERSIYLNAKRQDVYLFLLDFLHYHEWQPARELDPQIKPAYEGPKGKGGKYIWKGNEQVGSGSLEIVKADPFRFIEMKVIYEEPWQAEATYQYRISSDNQGTKVTWRYEADNSYFSRISMLFMNMDKLLGNELERGLERMRDYYYKWKK